MNPKTFEKLLTVENDCDMAIPWMEAVKEALDEAIQTKDLEVRYDAITRAQDMLEEAEVITHDELFM